MNLINQRHRLFNKRYLGYHQALQDFGIKPDEGLEYTEEQQATMISSIEQFQAVLVTADYLAIKFIHKLKQETIFYEKKLSIISFDDIRYAALNDPPLTTIRLDQIKKRGKQL